MFSTDRFAELMGSLGAGSDDEQGDLEDPAAEIFCETRDIEKSMASIEKWIAALQSRHVKALTWRVGDEALRAEIDEIAEETKATSMDVSKALKKLDAELKSMCASDPAAASRFEYKSRRNQHARLTQKFVELVQSFQECQTKYKHKQEQTIRRQFKLVRPDATEAEVSQFVESGSTCVFQEQAFMSGTRTAQAAAALEDVQEKHEAIQRLERSIKELHELFLDMSMLVETQGGMLDTIEHSVAHSVEYSRSGVGELVKANRYAAAARRKQCILLVVLLTLGLGWVLDMACGDGATDTPTAAQEVAAGGDDALTPSGSCSPAMVIVAHGIGGKILPLLVMLVVFLVCCGLRPHTWCGCCRREQAMQSGGRRVLISQSINKVPHKLAKVMPQSFRRMGQAARSRPGSTASDVSKGELRVSLLAGQAQSSQSSPQLQPVPPPAPHQVPAELV
jgi:t-SNARE complex subunit (syntaxin)